MKNFIKSKECFISFAVALIPSILLWIFKPGDKVSYFVFSISLLINLILLWLFLMVLFSGEDNSYISTVEIIELRDNIFVCRPNKLLTQDAFVSFYFKISEFEKLVGYGYVSNIQTNGLIQITILDTEGDFSFEKQSNDSLTNLIIKPTVSINYINQKIIEKE